MTSFGRAAVGIDSRRGFPLDLRFDAALLRMIGECGLVTKFGRLGIWLDAEFLEPRQLHPNFNVSQYAALKPRQKSAERMRSRRRDRLFFCGPFKQTTIAPLARSGYENFDQSAAGLMQHRIVQLSSVRRGRSVTRVWFGNDQAFGIGLGTFDAEQPEERLRATGDLSAYFLTSE